MHTKIKTFLQSIHPVEDAILEAYLNDWEEVQFSKKQLITQAGQVQRNMYFVLEGIQKSYYLNDGKEYVMAFTYPPSFSGIPESFFNQRPSNCYLETITNSRFLRISYEQHQIWLEKHRPLETLFRRGVEHLLSGLLQRHYELMALNIETRLKTFLKRSPHLLNQIPHKDLAAYLRIDPTNFSKLLGKVKILV